MTWTDGGIRPPHPDIIPATDIEVKTSEWCPNDWRQGYYFN